MATPFHFEYSLAFSTDSAADVLQNIPALPGVFALRGEDPAAEPYLTRAADLRRRIIRLVAPADSQSKRLNLRERVRTIEYTVTGSEFESLLLTYNASAAIFGVERARKRLRLYTPYFLKLTLQHAHPRVYSSNRIARKNLDHTYGPFASRTAAERYCDAVLDLFKLRRCHEDLEVAPTHPGCAYGEMKKCMAPCNVSCTAEDYAAEARAVEEFLRTRGDSMLATIAQERALASAQMEFEQAAALHQQHEKVKAVAAHAAELVRPIPQLRAVIVQPASAREGDAQEAAVFLLEGGNIIGPQRLSTLGVRAVKEQTSVGSSLFAQPLMLEAVPLDPGAALSPAESPEARAERVLVALAAARHQAAEAEAMADHLSLLRRWYYRPEKSRVGEIFFPYADGTFPIRRILRGAARLVLGDPAPMAETQRDQVDAARTKILHEGRPGVERVVPVIGRKKKKKNTEDAEVAQSAQGPQSDAVL